jgi:hypothetical protein
MAAGRVEGNNWRPRIPLATGRTVGEARVKGGVVFYVYSLVVFFAGFTCGYGVRALMSRRRRVLARKQKEWARGRVVSLKADE